MSNVLVVILLFLDLIKLNILFVTFYIFCRLVGDNIDIMIYAKIQSQQYENRSIHWTQEYGILNRVNEPSLDRTRPQKPLKDIQLVNLLPSKEVQDNLNTRWAAMIARVVCKYLDKFNHLRSALVYHIPHRYSKEMANKSEMVK